MTMRSLGADETTTQSLAAGSTTQGIVIGARTASVAAIMLQLELPTH